MSDDLEYWKRRAADAEAIIEEFTEKVERHELCDDGCICADILDALHSASNGVRHRWNCDLNNGYGRWCSCG